MDERQGPSSECLENKLTNQTENSIKISKSIADIPPEVLTKILEYLVDTDDNRKNLLNYRIVNCLWKDLMEQIMEKNITSGKMIGFPIIRVRCGDMDTAVLEVQNFRKFFSSSCKPFPVNALVVATKDERVRGKQSSTYKRWVAWSKFMPTFTANLTSFGIKDMTIHTMDTIITLFGSMPSLKLISFTNVCIRYDHNKRPPILPKFPELTLLTTLHIESSLESETLQNTEISNILYIHIIVTYADQLESLSLNTLKSLPALQPQFQYNQRFRKKCYQSSTSASAFKKLKVLKISRPSTHFLADSRFPILEQLSLNNLFVEKIHRRNSRHEYPRDIQVIANFIKKFRTTLKSLRIDAPWSNLIGSRAGSSHHLNGTIPFELSRIMEDPFPLIKSIEVHYPSWYLEVIIMSEFVTFFPNITKIHFLNFPKKIVDPRHKVELEKKEMKPYLNFNELISDLTAANREIHECDRTHNQLQNIPLRSRKNWKLHEQKKDDIRQLKREKKETRDIILHQLYFFFEQKKHKLVVEQLLLLKDIWTICPHLKRVTASKIGNLDDGFCVISRPVDF